MTDCIRQLLPWNLYERGLHYLQRRTAEGLLANLSENGRSGYSGTVLVDATWDNPNYWVRYALLRATLGLSNGREIGVLGPRRARYQSRTLRRFGISETVKIADLQGKRRENREEAERLLAETRSPEDILNWKLPHGFPAGCVYDSIIKRQRTACVSLEDPQLRTYVEEALGNIASAEHLLDIYDFGLVVLSHTTHYWYASLAWIAAKRHVPVVCIPGDHGVNRFVKLERPQDFHTMWSHPRKTDFDVLAPDRARVLERMGLAYLRKRRDGLTGDIGGKYAFHRNQCAVDRDEFGRRFHWNPETPVVAIYSPAWFDFPHFHGMKNFRDFLDWTQGTLKAIEKNSEVNWLVKAHPLEDWYGGTSFRDLVALSGTSHIQMVPKEWNGSKLMDCVDGVVTYHGTAGIEYAAFGKPVLLADRGWYHDIGFTKWSKSRKGYLESLNTEWWKDLDLEYTARRARIFAGWYFCRPAWQKKFVLDDDSAQWSIYGKIPGLLAGNEEEIEREIGTLRAWFDSNHRCYHTYKINQAEEYVF